MGVCCIDGFQRPTLTVPLGEMPATRHFVLGRKPRFILCETGLLGEDRIAEQGLQNEQVQRSRTQPPRCISHSDVYERDNNARCDLGILRHASMFP